MPKQNFSGVLVKSEILRDDAPLEGSQKTTLQERMTLEKEFIMWEAASADFDYIQNMQAHNI